MDGETPLFIGADHPALPGHFPAHPIVPGVVILDLLVEEWRKRLPGAPIAGIRKMKFVRLLMPGEAFTVTWSEVRDGKLNFSAHVGDKPLASGQFVLR
jgi:3-hydroxyacyl-[acyl-carrier-protein] dehydratase